MADDNMKDEIVQQFLRKGKLLTPEALKMIEEKGLGAIKDEGFIVTKHSTPAASTTKNDSVRVLKNITEVKNELTADDFAQFYRSRHDRMKAVITGRVQRNFSSLNKLDNYRDEVHVIGMVRSIRESGDKIILDLEDMTAAVPIVFEKEATEDVELDDVVAVRAVSAKSMMFGKQIIFPDVPLRQPTTGWGRLCFAPSPNLDETPRQDAEKIFAWLEKNDIKNIFFAGDIGDVAVFENLTSRYCYGRNVFVVPGEKDKTTAYPNTPIKFSYDKIISLSNPSMVEINGIKILLTHNFAISMLKKRYLGRPKRITHEDHLVLEEVPDIVLFNHHNDPQITNYKSITIANPGSLLAGTNVIVIDLLTREAQQIAV